MPVLPIFNQDIATSIIGVMHFPNDIAKANAVASSILASGPLHRYRAEGGSLKDDEWLSLIESLAQGNFADEIKENYYIGSAVGQLAKTLWSLICRDPTSASWKKAMRIVEDCVVSQGGDAGFSTFHRSLKVMKPCLHLWGAHTIRREIFGKMWLADPSIGYDGFTDAKCFLMESEILLGQLLKWNDKFKMQSRHLDADHIRVWDNWEVPVLQPHWPKTGRVPFLEPSVNIPPDRKRGRRKKTKGVSPR